MDRFISLAEKINNITNNLLCFANNALFSCPKRMEIFISWKTMKIITEGEKKINMIFKIIAA